MIFKLILVYNTTNPEAISIRWGWLHRFHLTDSSKGLSSEYITFSLSLRKSHSKQWTHLISLISQYLSRQYLHLQTSVSSLHGSHKESTKRRKKRPDSIESVYINNPQKNGQPYSPKFTSPRNPPTHCLTFLQHNHSIHQANPVFWTKAFTLVLVLAK